MDFIYIRYIIKGVLKKKEERKNPGFRLSFIGKYFMITYENSLFIQVRYAAKIGNLNFLR